MKANKQELDVDFIGGEQPLTDSEERSLQAFFQKQKSPSESQIEQGRISILKNRKLKKVEA